MMTEPSRGQSQLERMFLHIMQAVTIASLVGGAVALTELKTSAAVMQVEMRALNKRFDVFEGRAVDRYTLTMAARDLARIATKQSDHEARIRLIERAKDN